MIWQDGVVLTTQLIKYFYGINMWLIMFCDVCSGVEAKGVHKLNDMLVHSTKGGTC